MCKMSTCTNAVRYFRCIEFRSQEINKKKQIVIEVSKRVQQKKKEEKEITTIGIHPTVSCYKR